MSTTPQSSKTSTTRKRNPPKARSKVTPRKGKGGRPSKQGLEERLDHAKAKKSFKQKSREVRRNYGRLRKVVLGLFSREEVEELAREVGFYRRKPREIRAFEFVLCSALAALVEQKRSFATVWRLMGAAARLKVVRSAVTQRFGTGSAKLMEEVVKRVSERLSRKTPSELDERLREFRGVLAHDGSVVRLSPLLQKLFPARRTTSVKSAIRVHGAADVVQRRLVRVVVTGDRDSELAVARSMPLEKGVLYMNDLGYMSYDYFADIKDAEAELLSRLKSNANPTITKVREGLRAPVKLAKERFGLNNPDLPNYFLKKADTFDLDAEFKAKGRTVKLRVVGVLDPEIDSYRMYVTTLSPEEYSPNEISQLYRYRWAIELLFKLLKTSCHMDHVDTSNVEAIKTHIYSSVLAAMLLYEVCNAAAEASGVAIDSLSYIVAGIASPLLVVPLLFLWFEHEPSFNDLIELILRVLTIGCANQNPKRTQKQRNISEGW